MMAMRYSFREQMHLSRRARKVHVQCFYYGLHHDLYKSVQNQGVSPLHNLRIYNVTSCERALGILAKHLVTTQVSYGLAKGEETD